MKKVIVYFMFLFVLLFANNSYARDAWITAGYSYFLPEENMSGGSATAPIGPITITLGGQLNDWIAMDFSIGYLWDYRASDSTYSVESSVDEDGNTSTTTYYSDINMLPIRLDVLFQPIIATGMFDILPYIGIGPQITLSNTDFQNNIFSYGFSAKAGVRFSEGWLMIGIGMEYLYNTPIEATYRGQKYTYKGSGLMFGGEIGIAF